MNMTFSSHIEIVCVYIYIYIYIHELGILFESRYSSVIMLIFEGQEIDFQVIFNKWVMAHQYATMIS